jgi:hypothetical protein
MLFLAGVTSAHSQNKKLPKLHNSVLGLHWAHNYPLLSDGQLFNATISFKAGITIMT